MIRPIRIHYLRPPDQLTIYRQTLVHETGEVKVTLARKLPFDPPLRIRGEVALEEGSDAVWFTFPGVWHDIGRFHGADGAFTGIYANMITPCVFQPGGEWETTDLFLDLWLPGGRGSELLLLDEEELESAEMRGDIPGRLADRARREARRVRSAWEDGSWPPPVVLEWTRERALATLQSASASAASTTWAAQSRSRST